MTSQFKNRLVGVTILVASVVIFLPSIIDGKKTTYEDEFVSTPIKPPFKKHRQEIDTKQMQETLNANTTQDAENNKSAEHWEIIEVAAPLTISNEDKSKVNKIVKVDKNPLKCIKKSSRRKKQLRLQKWRGLFNWVLFKMQLISIFY